MPDHSKTMEMSFGKILRYDEEFPGPMRIARELGIRDSAATIEQPIGPNNGYNLIRSKAIYYRVPSQTPQSKVDRIAELLCSASNSDSHFQNNKHSFDVHRPKAVHT
jgi:hypothetical protein